MFLLSKPESCTQADFREVRKHLTEATLQRPTWVVLATAQARLAELEGNPEDELNNYLRAIELGDRREAVVGRAVKLLCDHRRYPEADRLIQRAATQGQLSNELTRYAAALSVNNQENQKAVDLAGAAVLANSKNAEDHIFQARVYKVAGRDNEAKAALRKAVDLMGTKEEEWAALVSYYVWTRKPEEIDGVIAEMGKRMSGPALTLATARCLEAARRFKEAGKLYYDAIAARPGDPDTAIHLIEFHERVGFDEGAVSREQAITTLRKFLDDPKQLNNVARIRRVLATGLATDGNYAHFHDALTLLDKNLAEGARKSEDIMAKARVFATRLAYRVDAIALLRELSGRKPFGPDAEFLLGQLLADTEQWSEGRKLMVNVLIRDEGNVAGLQFFIDRLIRNNALSDAESWLDKLEPDDLATIRLRTLCFARQDHDQEAADHLAKKVPSTGKPRTDVEWARVRALAGTADSIDHQVGKANSLLLTLAEELYREAAKSGRPADLLALADHLGRRGRIDDALLLVKQAETSAKPNEVAGTLLNIVYSTTILTEGQLNAIEAELRKCLEKVAGSPEAASARGLFHARRARYEEAAKEFRILMKANPDAATMNNVAYMLLLSNGSMTEIEDLLAKAETLVGRPAELLDTRGMARLKAGRIPEAMEDLTSALDQEPTAARWLHLGLAYKKAGTWNAVTEKKVLEKIEEFKNDGTLVLPAESKDYKDLKGKEI